MPALKGLDSNDIFYVALRNFRLDGVDYVKGQVVEALPPHYKLQMLVGSRRICPVVEDDKLNGVPRAFQKDVKRKSIVMKKLGVSSITNVQQAQPWTGTTIDEVKTWLAANLTPAAWAKALLFEHTHQNRSTLVAFIKAGKAGGGTPTAEEIELVVLDDDSYKSGGALFGYPVAEGEELYS